MNERRTHHLYTFLVLISCILYLWTKGVLGIFSVGYIVVSSIMLLLSFFVQKGNQNNRKLIIVAAGAALFFLFLKHFYLSGTTLTASVNTLLSLPFIFICLNLCCGKLPEALSQKIRHFVESTLFFALCIAAATTALLIQIYFSFSSNIWLDESFSLAITSHSWGEMLAIATTDVHPPLYYIFLKGLTQPIHFLFPQLSVICIGKLISVIPYAILLLLSVTKVRCTWGNYVGGLWGVALFAAPSLITQGVEIRMYGWAMLFATLSYLFAYDVSEANRKRDWVLFVFSGIAAAYTHYYACIAVTPVYLFLLYNSYQRGRRALLYWLLAAGMTVIAYIPWLFVFLGQARAVSADYWIQLPDLATYYRYTVDLLQDELTLGTVLLIILLLLLSRVRSREQLPHTRYILTGILCSATTIGIGLAASYLIRPVFVFRYLYPGLACFWLALIICCKVGKNTLLKLSLAIMLLGTYLCQLMTFILSEGNQAKEHNKLMAELNKWSDAVFIANSNDQQCIFSTLTGKNCLSYDTEEASTLTKSVYEVCRQTNISDIERFLNQKEHPTYVVIIFDTVDSEESLQKTLQNYYVGKFKERDFFNMYVIPSTENGAEH